MNEEERQQRREAYREKLRDPRWQAKRLEILKRDDWTCQNCGYYAGESAHFLQVHHHWYDQTKEPWEYSNEALIALCRLCHEAETLWRAEMEGDLLAVLKRKGFLGSDLVRLASRINQSGVDRERPPRREWGDSDRFLERNEIRERKGLPPISPDGLQAWGDYDEDRWIEPE